MEKGTKIALAIGGLAIVGVGGFFLFKQMKKKKEQQQLGGGSSPMPSSAGSSGGSSGGSSSSSSPAPSTSTGLSGASSIGRLGGLISQTTSNLRKGCGGSYTKTGFPLEKGSCGFRVVELQKYLGITADGKFGSNTGRALKSKQNLVVAKPVGYSAGYGKVSEADYKAIA